MIQIKTIITQALSSVLNELRFIRVNLSKYLNVKYYPALVLFEQSSCVGWIIFCYILSLTGI